MLHRPAIDVVRKVELPIDQVTSRAAVFILLRSVLLRELRVDELLKVYAVRLVSGRYGVILDWDIAYRILAPGCFELLFKVRDDNISRLRLLAQ
jgi:hypothetical protein